MKYTADELDETANQPLASLKQAASDSLIEWVVKDGDDFVMTYHHGDVGGITEYEYWVVSVTRRKLDAMAELADEFVYAGA